LSDRQHPSDDDVFAGRANLVERSGEAWRPPLLTTPGGKVERAASAARRFFDVQAMSIWRDLVPELRKVRGTLADIGCGAQPYRGLLAPGVEYIGIDIAEAEEHFGYKLPDTRYFTGDTWPLDDASVDTMLATETLEHVVDPPAFMREAYRCLKPGGTLILTVPFSARWHFVPHDYWRFTPSSLALLLTESGFTKPRVYARGNAVTVAAYKTTALVFPLLFPQHGSRAKRLGSRAAGVVGLPVVLAGAVVANLSLRSSGGDDCLGYTVLAERPAAEAA
jgi:SAM-dependent methyltransferase